jgi:phage terminase large subunit
MGIIQLPNNWSPREYQLPLWQYLEDGGTYAYQIAHRRWGKDEVSLHRTACAAFERVGSYWHLLPEATHARKAIWSSVNPHTGKRRIDEAFPRAIRKVTREQEMFIEFINGSTWQVGGSDRYDTLVGSSPAGVVFSEWALANPAAWAYVRPIMAENHGWAIFITTPRGHNHAERMHRAAQKMPHAYCAVSAANDTGVFTPESLARERREMIDEYGEDFGAAMFAQEYECSFEAALIGSYYAAQISALRAKGQLGKIFAVDPSVPIHFAFDIGFSDDTAIWVYQVLRGEIHVLGCYAMHNRGPAHYLRWVYQFLSEHAERSQLGNLYLPHDARAKTFVAAGKTVEEMFAIGCLDDEAKDCVEEYVIGVGWEKVRIVPNISIQDGIQSVRTMLPLCYFHQRCEPGLEALGQYRREWNEKHKVFHEKPLHDWTSHYADGFRMMGVQWKEEYTDKKKAAPPRFETQLTIDELIKRSSKRRAGFGSF